MHWAAALVPAFFLHFAAATTGRLRPPALVLTDILSAAFLVLTQLPALVAGVRPQAPFEHLMVAGPFSWTFTAFFAAVWTGAAVHFYRQSRRAEGQRKAQLDLLFMGSLLGYAGIGAPLAPVYGWDIPGLFPHGIFAVTAYVVLMTIAIVRYGLLDLDNLVRRMLVAAGLVFFVAGAYGGALVFFNGFGSEVLGLDPNWAGLTSLLAVMLGYDPARRLFAALVDRLLFRRKYNYQKLLKDATAGISKIENLDHLLSLVVHFVTMKVRVKNAAILTHRSDTKTYTLRFQRGYGKNFVDYYLKDSDPLIEYLQREKEPLDLDRIEAFLEGARKPPVRSRAGEGAGAYDFKAMRQTLEELEAACCVPSFLGRDLKNILILGRKKSGNY
jgi:hypothetical protein